MARVVVEGTDIVVRLSWWEKVVTRHGDVRVPGSALRRSCISSPTGGGRFAVGAVGAPGFLDGCARVSAHFRRDRTSRWYELRRAGAVCGTAPVCAVQQAGDLRPRP